MLENPPAELERLRAALRERLELEDAAARFAPLREGSDVLEAATRLEELDIEALGDDTLVELTSQVEHAQRRIDAARCRLHGALDARGTTVERTGHVTQAWLGAEHGLPRAEAGRRVRVASKLRRHLPLVQDALGRGEITFDHARVIADLLTPRVAEVVVALQAPLVHLARGVRFERWVQEVRDLINAADADGGHDPSPERNRLSMADGLDGELFLRGTFVGEHAAVLRHTLSQMADRLFHRARRDERAAPDDLPLPTRPRLLADALVELCRLGAAASDRARTATDVSLVIDAGDPTVAHTPDGVRLADGTTRLLMCDPVITAVVRDSLGVTLDMGTKVRFGTPPQRRAALVRDGGCVFPGCDVPPSQVDLHHLVQVIDQGTTDMSNLASLCRRHHGVVHRAGWSMSGTGGEWFAFVTPTGATLPGQRHGRQRHQGPPRAGP